MEEWGVLLDWIERHAKIWLRFWLENKRLGRESEVHEKIYQRFLALVLPRIHDKAIQAKSLEYKQLGREGTYFTVSKYHSTQDVEIQRCQVPANKLGP